mmetsp:Transcript_15606/g.24409  ORF Transcript_15606/g.24409 Transcript_15606/m.24409 type:complete len:457 (-) Transcript_15606:108-1478(-)|eukprot:CAMPEP_0201543304 /NCGR_PEP_ID=MMETSP0161_2-20130828/72526_1 /ASSEMBLY_ACC=CAM_ASM_000251 /TAXON_ID=180227 /ORGANISM="Neoparamoeba aestuarina, Strain SoJaBio B1-5/56/2" /LENGTH=456 /DNA_ID=CAMNT_0047951071 /DNA_START=158 /DNA_END=1528 /DNA_ORIENTATION=-
MDDEHAALTTYVRELESQKGVLVRTFKKNQTIVEQETKNTCFYHLKSGSIRFEKRVVDEKNVIKHATILGQMEDTAPWTFFCELSAFGIQEKTSAAIVAETAADIAVIPVEAFFEFSKSKPLFQLLFYKLITKRLAQMLRGLHSRTLNLSSLSLTTSGQQIHNEAVIFAWPCSVKAKVGKSEGQLILSKNYISFVKKKVADRKGVVADASDVPSQTIIALKEIVEISFNGAKIMVRDSTNKINVSLKKGENPDVVKDVIAMAKNSSSGQNKAAQSGSNATETESQTLNKEDQALLESKFKSVKIKPGEIVQKNGEPVNRIAYVLEGSLSVQVKNSDGKDVKLSDIVVGETAGDIGVFLQTDSSAELSAGESGAKILEIPKDFLFGADDQTEFRVRLYFSLLKLMWNRIIRQETNQVKTFVKRMDNACGAGSFLGESLMREGACTKNIDQMSNLGWY